MTAPPRIGARILAALSLTAALVVPLPGAPWACAPRPADPEAAGAAEIERLARRLAEGLEGLDRRRSPGPEPLAVAVPDFQNHWDDTSELGRHLAQQLTADLVAELRRAGSDAPRVIDRHHLAEILAERRRGSEGLISSPAGLAGEIGGVDALVAGKVVSLADSIELSIHVLDLRDGSAVVVTDSAVLPRTARLSELEGRTLRVRHIESLDVTELWTDRPPLGSWPPRRPETFRVDLQGCGRLEESVYCLFAIQAVGQDRSVSVFGTSRAVLPDGSQASAAQVQVGASTATGPSVRVGAPLVEGVPTAAALRFDDIPADAHEILRLTLDLFGKKAEFEQVPIERL